MQGSTDIPLNDEGRSMAKKACKECGKINFDICYCSPLSRAKETAKLVLEGRDVPIIYDDRLVEMKFGIYEGVQNAAKEENSPIRTFFKNPEEYRGVEGGESFEDLFKRTGEFLEEVVKPQLENNKDVLIVGHGAMNSSILCQVKNVPLKNFWDAGIENCKLMRLL